MDCSEATTQKSHVKAEESHNRHQKYIALPGVSNPQPVGHMQPRMAMNVAQHKIRNLLKTFFFFFLLISFC